VASSRPASFLPDSSSAFDKHRTKEEGLALFATFTRFSMSGYLVTGSAPALLPANAHRSLSVKSTGAAPKVSKEIFEGISTAT